MSIPASFHNLPGWQRQVADRVNPILTQTTSDIAKLDYSGNAGKVLKVNSAGDGVEFSSEWTYIVLGSDFSTTSASAVDVTGLAFTPAASTSYEFEALLLCRTSSAGVAALPGLAWPTGGTDGVAEVTATNAAGGADRMRGNISASVLSGATNIPDATNSHMGTVRGMFIAGGSPSGTVKLQLASEIGGTSVSVKAGSFLKYRVIG